MYARQSFARTFVGTPNTEITETVKNADGLVNKRLGQEMRFELCTEIMIQADMRLLNNWR